MRKTQMELTGTIHSISDTIQISDKFRKRELILIIDQDTKYPQYIAIEAVQDKCSMFDGLGKGDNITVSLYFASTLEGGEGGAEAIPEAGTSSGSN